MAYQRHEMSVMLFSGKDDIFTDTEVTSDNDNEWEDSNGNYDDDDNPSSSFDW